MSCGQLPVLPESRTTHSTTRSRGFSYLRLREPRDRGKGLHDALFHGGVHLELFLSSPSPDPLGSSSSFLSGGGMWPVGLGDAMETTSAGTCPGSDATCQERQGVLPLWSAWNAHWWTLYTGEEEE